MLIFFPENGKKITFFVQKIFGKAKKLKVSVENIIA